MVKKAARLRCDGDYLQLSKEEEDLLGKNTRKMKMKQKNFKGKIRKKVDVAFLEEFGILISKSKVKKILQKHIDMKDENKDCNIMSSFD